MPCAPEDTHKNAYSSIVHNSAKLELKFPLAEWLRKILNIHGIKYVQ